MQAHHICESPFQASAIKSVVRFGDLRRCILDISLEKVCLIKISNSNQFGSIRRNCRMVHSKGQVQYAGLQPLWEAVHPHRLIVVGEHRHNVVEMCFLVLYPVD